MTETEKTTERTGRGQKMSWEHKGKGVSVITFADDSTATVDFGKYPKEIQEQIIDYGVRQLHNDRCSQFSEPNEVKAKFKATHESLLGGQFRAVRESSGPRSSLVCRALARVYDRDIADVIAQWETLDEDTQKQARSDLNVKYMMKQIQAEAADAARKAKEAKGEKTAGSADMFAIH